VRKAAERRANGGRGLGVPNGPAAGAGPIRRARRFARDEGGSVTVEAVLWLPFFFGILMLITDVSLAFYAKAQAFRIIQDANRAFSVRRVTDPDDVATAVEGAFATFAPSANATTAVSSDGVVSTVMTFPIDEVILFVPLRSFADLTVTVGAQHYVE
jgi:Flp pilus assembly protein TadG